MLFEDERENIIGDAPELEIIEDDNTVPWDSILNDTPSETKETPKKVNISKNVAQVNNDLDLPDINSLDLGDELELIQDEDLTDTSSSTPDEDEELMRILNNDSANQNDDLSSTDESIDGTEDFDIDKQLQQIQDKDNNASQDSKPKTNNTNIIIILVLILVALIVASIAWFVLNSNANKEDELPQVLAPEITNQQNENVQQQDAIPVINEEETDTLKPEEEEKKEVVNVIDTGRENPFLPLKKYSPAKVEDVIKTETVVKTINTIDYDSFKLPALPKEYAPLDENTTNLMSIIVSGIMHDDKKPSAIITYKDNDYFVQIGDKLDKFKIVDIAKGYVKIALGNNVYRANLGEEFKFNEFYGNAQYVNGNKGARQYYSSEETYQGRETAQRDVTKRYTSEDDVIINGKQAK